MDLIDKKDGLSAIHAEPVLCRFHRLLHIFFAGGRGVELDKLRTGGIGDHPGQSGLAGPRRAVEDQRTQLVRLDGPSQKTPFSYNTFLPDDFVKAYGADPGSKRGLRLLLFLPHVVK